MKWIILMLVMLTFTNRADAYRVDKVTPSDIKKDTKRAGHVAPEQLTAAAYQTSKGQTLPYRIFRPDERSKDLPLVVFLHGIGEAGNDNIRQLKHSQILHFAHKDAQRRNPCYLIAPQHLPGEHWANLAIRHPSPPLQRVMELIDQLIKDERIDPKRVYFCGLSSGGNGALDAATLFPEKVAAALVVSAASSPTILQRRNQSAPVWFSCNEEDKDVFKTVQTNADLLHGLRVEVKVSVAVKRGNHSAWDWAFSQKKMIDWLFKQSLR